MRVLVTFFWRSHGKRIASFGISDISYKETMIQEVDHLISRLTAAYIKMSIHWNRMDRGPGVCT